jgi:hypothetical protein
VKLSPVLSLKLTALLSNTFILFVDTYGQIQGILDDWNFDTSCTLKTLLDFVNLSTLKLSFVHATSSL